MVAVILIFHVSGWFIMQQWIIETVSDKRSASTQKQMSKH